MWLEIIFLILISTITKVPAIYYIQPLMSTDAKFVIYGNIASFDDLFSVKLNYSDELVEPDENDQGNEIADDEADQTRRMIFENELKSLNLIDDLVKGDESLPDVKDYSDITKGFNFRRVWHYYKKAGSGGWIFSWMGIYGNMGIWDYNDAKDMEEQKLDMLENCGLQFLIHARYKIQEAMRWKSGIRGDKRYMLGYLFNRVRRVIYESRKVLFIARMTRKYRMRKKLRALLRLYQQLARYDVDLVDLTRYIRRVYFKKADFDRYELTSSKKPMKSQLTTK